MDTKEYATFRYDTVEVENGLKGRFPLRTIFLKIGTEKKTSFEGHQSETNVMMRKETFLSVGSKSRDYEERQVDKKKRKVFVTAHVIQRMAAMFLASALNRGSHPLEI